MPSHDLSEFELAKRQAAILQRQRDAAATIADTDPAGATILRNKADLIAEGLRDMGYDESGEPLARS